MSLLYQALLVFGLTLLVLGYFQYRRRPDVVHIAQEMFRPGYLVPAAIIAVAYIILKLTVGALAGIL